jgi:hypothetical protein
LSGSQSFFFPSHLKIVDGLACVMHCAIDILDENKEIGTVLNLFHKHLGTSIMLIYVFLLILFHNSFVVSVVPGTA